MQHSHILITAGATIDNTSRFYRVWVGQSRQADRDYLFLLNWCVTHGYYFERYTTEVQSFLFKIADSIAAPAADPHVDSLHLLDIKARDLVRHIKAGTSPSYPENALHNAHHVRAMLDTNYRISCNFRGNTKLPVGQRKKT